MYSPVWLAVCMFSLDVCSCCHWSWRSFRASSAYKGGCHAPPSSSLHSAHKQPEWMALTLECSAASLVLASRSSSVFCCSLLEVTQAFLICITSFVHFNFFCIVVFVVFNFCCCGTAQFPASCFSLSRVVARCKL